MYMYSSHINVLIITIIRIKLRIKLRKKILAKWVIGKLKVFFQLIFARQGNNYLSISYLYLFICSMQYQRRSLGNFGATWKAFTSNPVLYLGQEYKNKRVIKCGYCLGVHNLSTLRE